LLALTLPPIRWTFMFICLLSFSLTRSSALIRIVVCWGPRKASTNIHWKFESIKFLLFLYEHIWPVIFLCSEFHICYLIFMTTLWGRHSSLSFADVGIEDQKVEVMCLYLLLFLGCGFLCFGGFNVCAFLMGPWSHRVETPDLPYS
jgi:hypothetical protein